MSRGHSETGSDLKYQKVRFLRFAGILVKICYGWSKKYAYKGAENFRISSPFGLLNIEIRNVVIEKVG